MIGVVITLLIVGMLVMKNMGAGPSGGMTPSGAKQTIDRAGNPVTLSMKGRHDISAIPRINVVCEAMVSLVLADHLLRQRAIS